MCCPSSKVITSDSKCFLAIGGLHEDKLFGPLQVMAPTNVKTVRQTSLLNIKSNLDRVGLLSLIYDRRSQQQNGHITRRSVLINAPSKVFKATHHVEIRKREMLRSMVVEALN